MTDDRATEVRVAPDSDAVRAEQLRLLAGSLPPAILVGLLVAAVLAAVQWPHVGHAAAGSWLVAQVAIAGARLAQIRVYRRRRDDTASVRRLRGAVAGALAAGLAWGAAALLLFPAGEPLYQALLVITIAGVAAGAASSLSAVPAAAVAFLLAALVPLVGRCLALGAPAWLVIAAMVVLFGATTLAASLRMGRSTVENIRLRMEGARQRDALQGREEQYRTLVESTSAVFWEQDPATLGFTFVSGEAANVLGYPVRDWLEQGRDFWVGHMHPDDRAWVPARFEADLGRGEGGTYVYRMRAADGRTVWLRDVASVLVRDGRPVKNVGVMLDITASREAELALEYVSGLQRTLVEVSRRFIAAGRGAGDDVVSDALARVGAYCGVDRCYQFRYRLGMTRMDNTHEWCAIGVDPQIEDLQDMPCADMPRLTAAMARREVVHIPRVADLDEEWCLERAILAELEIESLVLVPVVAGETTRGFLGFDSVDRQRTWGDEEIRLLCVLADLIGAMTQRDEAEAALRES